MFNFTFVKQPQLASGYYIGLQNSKASCIFYILANNVIPK